MSALGSSIERVVLTSPYDGFSLGALHLPPRAPRLGGAIILQEVFGLSAHVRQVMYCLSEWGYETIAPSLFDRIEADFIRPTDEQGLDEGIAAARATPNAQAIADMRAAIDRLDGGPNFAVGFCFGGVMAWLAAQNIGALNGAVCFYGRRIIDELSVPLLCPVLMHYGEHDRSIPLSDVQAIVASGRYPKATIHIYEGAGHAFCREGGSNFDASSRELAFQRTREFMRSIGEGALRA